MRMEITVAEFKELFKGLGSPDELFEMLRVDIREQVGRYFTELMRTELTGFLGRERYERPVLSTTIHPDIKRTLVVISERTGMTVSQVADEVLYTGLVTM